MWDESVYNAECICWHSLIMKQVSCFPFVMFINPFFVALSSIELLTRFKPSVFILTRSNCVCQIDHISPRCLRKLDKKLFISYRGFFFILWSLEEVGFWRLLLEKSKLCERNMTRRRMMSSTSKSSSPYFKTCLMEPGNSNIHEAATKWKFVHNCHHIRTTAQCVLKRRG